MFVYNSSLRKNTTIWSHCVLILRSISPVEASGVFWISLFGFDNCCWKYFRVRPKSNKPSCHRFNRTFWQILFKWKLDFSKEQTSCTPFMSCFQKAWSSLFFWNLEKSGVCWNQWGNFCWQLTWEAASWFYWPPLKWSRFFLARQLWELQSSFLNQCFRKIEVGFIGRTLKWSRVFFQLANSESSSPTFSANVFEILKLKHTEVGWIF